MIPLPTPGEVEAGAAIWRFFRPWLRLRMAIRNRVNKRRARLGKPLLPPFDEKETSMPPHVVSWSGLAVTVIGIALNHFGIPQCTADVVAAAGACVDPSAVQKIVADIADLAQVGGPALVALGKWRSMKREKALTAQVAAQAPQG